jgi:hypothetical protein
MNADKETHESVEQGESGDEEVEMPVIAQTNAVAQPRAMMVKILDAIITDGAMPGGDGICNLFYMQMRFISLRGARRSEYAAGEAIFEFDWLATNIHDSSPGLSPFILVEERILNEKY